MLVLRRMKNEHLLLLVPGLEEPIVVSVVEYRHDQMRLGITAPKEVKILRNEHLGGATQVAIDKLLEQIKEGGVPT
jgi:carbon storage regulator CsrA